MNTFGVIACANQVDFARQTKMLQRLLAQPGAVLQSLPKTSHEMMKSDDYFGTKLTRLKKSSVITI